jgi:hypothetical protein
MPAGRPRTSVPEKEELIKLGIELVEWASDASEEAKKERRWRFVDWYCIKEGFVKKQWDHMLEKPEFRSYYEQARHILSKNYIDGTIQPTIAHRFLWKYVDDVKESEKEELLFKHELVKELEAYKATLKNNEDAEIPPKLQKLLDILEQKKDNLKTKAKSAKPNRKSK